MTTEPASAVASLPPEEAVPVRKEGRFHHGDLRLSLLAAASRAIADRSDTDISLRDLARGLGVTHAAAYRHFTSKADILAALATRGWQRLMAVVAEAIGEEIGDDEAEILRRVGERMIAFGRANPGPLRAMHLKDLREGARFEALEASATAVHACIEGVIAAGHAKGALRRDLPAGDVADAFELALFGLSLGLAARPDPEAASIAAHFIEAFVSGLRPPRRPSQPVAAERKEKKKEPTPMLTLDLFG